MKKFYYGEAMSPMGKLFLAGSDQGLLKVSFAHDDFARTVHLMEERLQASATEAQPEVDFIADELREYFSGTRTTFTVPLDRSLSSGFAARVHEAISTVGFGETVSYGQLATLVNSPGAVRAVGTACGKNPIPVVVPCHRVLRSDGSLGGYSGGVGIKAELLHLER